MVQPDKPVAFLSHGIIKQFYVHSVTLSHYKYHIRQCEKYYS